MTAEKTKLLHRYKTLPNDKINPSKRRLPRMDNDQWERLCNMAIWKGHIAPTQLPVGINSIPK